MSFGNKLGTNETRFLNLVFNHSESRFEGYPARRRLAGCYLAVMVCRALSAQNIHYYCSIFCPLVINNTTNNKTGVMVKE